MIVMSTNYFMFCTLNSVQESSLVSKKKTGNKNVETCTYPAVFNEYLIFVPSIFFLLINFL